MVISCRGVRPNKKYILLEYIESTGTQWIDTGISAPNGFSVFLDLSISTISGSNVQNCFIGAHNDAQPYGRNFLSVFSASFQIGEGDGMQNFGETVTGTRIILEASNIFGEEYAKINGEDQSLQASDTPSGDYSSSSLYLFFINGGRSYFSPSQIKLYGANVTVNGLLAGKFVPAMRLEDNAIGMWNEINGEFHANIGSGVFLAGPEV